MIPLSKVIAGRGFLVISHLLGRSSRRHLTLELLQVEPSHQARNHEHIIIAMELFSDLPEADQVPRDVPLEQHGPPPQAAARPLPLQPLALDTHSGDRAGLLHVLEHRC